MSTAVDFGLLSIAIPNNQLSSVKALWNIVLFYHEALFLYSSLNDINKGARL